MRYTLFVVFISIVLSSCSDNNEPMPDVCSQVTEITNGKSDFRNIFYDDYGRVIKYVAIVPDGNITSTYSYHGNDMIKIHTEVITYGLFDNEDVIREYDDEMYLENGQARYCDGIFTTNQLGHGSIFQKKYRYEFLYSSDNHLNVIKNTEWNKRGDSWAYDKPWSWDNYYKWENNNLIIVENYAGKKVPTYIYKYTYSSISGVQNILPIHLDRFQYYPLQLKGYFGAEPENLIIGIEQIRPDAPVSEALYRYTVNDNIITNYVETRDGVDDDYIVDWTR